MTWGRFLVLLFVCALLASRALADGKFYIAERVPEVPFQRAAIWHNGEREIMVVQSRYDAKSSAGLKEIGWVLPLPAIPEVGTMSAATATHMFNFLDIETRPKSVIWLHWIMVGALGLAALMLVLTILHFGWHNVSLLVFALIVLIVGGVLDDRNRPKSASKGGPPPAASSSVELVRETTAGVYEIKVVKADSHTALIDWLKRHGFRFDSADERIFADYIGRGWCFVTARIAPTKLVDAAALDAASLVNPLVLRFATKEAVYPLALTATAGQSTEILLYLLSMHKSDTGGRILLEFAAPHDRAAAHLKDVLTEGGIEPSQLLSAEDFPERFLTKVKGRLSAKEMRTDLVLKQALDDETYRIRKYYWTMWDNPYSYWDSFL